MDLTAFLSKPVLLWKTGNTNVINGLQSLLAGIVNTLCHSVRFFVKNEALIPFSLYLVLTESEGLLMSHSKAGKPVLKVDLTYSGIRNRSWCTPRFVFGGSPEHQILG